MLRGGGLGSILAGSGPSFDWIGLGLRCVV